MDNETSQEIILFLISFAAIITIAFALIQFKKDEDIRLQEQQREIEHQEKLNAQRADKDCSNEYPIASLSMGQDFTLSGQSSTTGSVLGFSIGIGVVFGGVNGSGSLEGGMQEVYYFYRIHGDKYKLSSVPAADYYLKEVDTPPRVVVRMNCLGQISESLIEVPKGTVVRSFDASPK